LLLQLSLPNGTRFGAGRVFAGSFGSNFNRSAYLIEPISPGTYSLNMTNASNIFFPPTTVRLVQGINLVNLTVYPLSVFVVFATPNLTLNKTQPGPVIAVRNTTAVEFVFHNNTTLVQDIAVTRSLYNTSASSILFDSLSSSVSAGGSVNDTFIVSQAGSFYYDCLIGNDASGGEWGVFSVSL
jgi:hypothetical protein